MPQLSLDTGDCDPSPMDFHPHYPDGSPQVNPYLGYFGTPPLAEGTDDPTSISNGCGNHHTFGPHECNAGLSVRASVLSRRSHEGSLWKRHAMPGIDREKDLDGQTLGTEAVATGDDSFDYYPNTEPSNASPRLIYTKRRKSGVGDQNPLPGGHGNTDDLSKQSPAQGNGGANSNGSNQGNGNSGAGGNGGGPGNGNGNGNNNGNGNGNGAGNTSPGTPSGGTATGGGVTPSSTASDSLPTVTSSNVGPTSGASTPSTSTPSVPTETSNGNGSSTLVSQSNSDGNPASTTNQNDQPTTPAGAVPTIQASATASQFPNGSTGGGNPGIIEVSSTISTVSTFTSTGIAVVTSTSGSSVFTITKPTTSIGVTTLSIPTTVAVPNNDTQRHSSSKAGPIVGAVIGTILGCILLLVMLLWFRRRQRRRNNVGFFYLTPAPGQRDAELSNMSQATDLRARASVSPFPSVLSLPSLLDINRSRTPTTDTRRSSDLGSLPYELLPRASSNDHFGLYRNNSSIDYPHSENPFADPSLNENTIDTAEMTVPVASSNPFVD